MVHETVIKLDAVPETLYSLHQQVWSMLSRSSEQERDFLYALDRNCGELYVRATSAREEFGPWRELAPLAQGRRYRAVGTLAIDATRSRVRGQEALGWRHPQLLERRVRAMFERFLQVDSLAIALGSAEPLGKNRRQAIYFTPLRVRAEGAVTDAAKANAALEHGIGRAKAFGFGAVHFIPLERLE